jgi:hypothetical protein
MAIRYPPLAVQPVIPSSREAETNNQYVAVHIRRNGKSRTPISRVFESPIIRDMLRFMATGFFRKWLSLTQADYAYAVETVLRRLEREQDLKVHHVVLTTLEKDVDWLYITIPYVVFTS